MSYDVLEVCRHVINYSNEQDYGISNLKLQKVLYLIQAYFLIDKTKNASCFDDKIESWDFGPVIPCAYNEYKQYANGDIPTIESYYLFDTDTDLVSLTHKQSPWINSYVPNQNNEISIDAIKRYFQD